MNRFLDTDAMPIFYIQFLYLMDRQECDIDLLHNISA